MGVHVSELEAEGEEPMDRYRANMKGRFCMEGGWMEMVSGEGEEPIDSNRANMESMLCDGK